MNPSDIILLGRWQERRDAKAFQELVSRHGGMVYAASRRILRNAEAAEEIAQECFLALAQTKARDIRLLGGWLHSFATRRSLDRLRSDKRRQDRERRYSEAKPAHVEPTLNDIQEFVDEAISALPEHLSCVVIDHFLEGHKQAEIARSLELSPSAVSRRVDTAVKHIRDSLEKRGVVTGATALTGLLATGASGAAPNSLTATLGKLALSGARHVAHTPAVAPTTGLLTPAVAKLGLAALIVAMIAALGYTFQYRRPAEGSNRLNAAMQSESEVAREEIAEAQVPPVNAGLSPEVAPAVPQAQGSASVSGVVVFRDSGEPAEGMRVTLGSGDGDDPVEMVTGADGTFAFGKLSESEFVLLAYDARHGEVPEDSLRSEHVELKLAQGEDKEGVRIEVPPVGGAIGGRVIDEATGAPLAGITVEAFRFGVASHTVKTGRDGGYTMLGLSEGEWIVRRDRNNPIFSSDTIDTMERAVVENGKTTELDLSVERGMPVSGRVVDSEDRPIVDAWVDAVIFLNEGNVSRMSSYLMTDARGRFTFWDRTGSERMVLSASKTGVGKSSAAVVAMIDDGAAQDVLLKLHPAVNVSGRFFDEHGGRVKANFWRRPTHPDGNGEWRGESSTPKESFEVSLGRGTYEIKGQAKGRDFGVEEVTQTIEVGSGDIADLVVKVRTGGAITGQYTLRGTVVDENGKPLRRTRVYADGSSRENIRSFQETDTDAQGRFAFDGLVDGHYRVHATLSDPFEKFAGFNDLNPADTSEITIVARRSGVVRGRVLDARTGEPITRFRTEYGGLDPADPRQREIRWEVKKVTSETGLYEIPMRLEKDWFVRITAEGYAPIRHTGSPLVSGQVVDGLDFRLLPSRIVHGTVTTVSGAPVDDALVYHDETAFDVMRRKEQYAAAMTDSDGAFTLQSLPAETQFIYVRKPDFAVAKYPVADDMKIVLTEGGVIEGRFLGGATTNEKLSIMAMDVDNPRSYYSGRVEDDGSYRIAALMDGAYRLNINIRDAAGNFTGGFATDEAIEAVNGMTTTYDVSIPNRSSVLEGTVLQDAVAVADIFLVCIVGGITVSGSTDEAGYFRFENLPSGLAEISMLVGNAENALKPSYKTIGEVDIEAGATTHQDFDLTNIE